MKVLLTNIQLNSRTGTEVVVRDLAIGLLRRGNEVAVYTPNPGSVADELARNGLTVVDAIDSVPFIPDVVHGHHHTPTVEALVQFPTTRAVWVCHDRSQYEDIPPRHPGVARYVAVDLNCRERLVIDAGVPANLVNLVHNAIDLSRFGEPRRLPERCTRAAIFSNQTQPGGYADVIGKACRTLGIELDLIGGITDQTFTPELDLSNYDLVFAKARCALEAMAAGCCVVLIDHVGMGPMVSTVNVGILRDWNFGARCLQGKVSVARVVEEIGRYEPVDAGLVTSWIRDVANIERSLDRYLDLYRAVVDEGPVEHSGSVITALASSLQYSSFLERRISVLREPILSPRLPPTITAEIECRVIGETGVLAPGSSFGVDVLVANRSNETLSSLMPYPVHLSYHWECPTDRARDVFEGRRTAVSKALYPGGSSTIRMMVDTPPEPGAYVLKATLVQESNFWFDQLTPPVVSERAVEVRPADDSGAPWTLDRLVRAVDLRAPSTMSVERDGWFTNLGFLEDRLDDMLVFVGTPALLERAVRNTSVRCVVTTQSLAQVVPRELGVLVATDPKAVFFEMHNWLSRRTDFFAAPTLTMIAESARVHPSAWIDPYSVVIGDDCRVGPHAVIHGPVVIGARCRIDAGAVIGATAFQTSDRGDDYVELEHAGGVDIGDDCHVFSNAVIARAVFRDSTRIGDRCQVGNGAFISHQCRLGKRVFIGHNATVNGRVVIADGAWVGPGTVIANDITVGRESRVALGAAVMQDVLDRESVSGLPAMHQHTMFRHAAAIRRSRR